eukprot:757189-Hanusia_phi.AAC.1
MSKRTRKIEMSQACRKQSGGVMVDRFRTGSPVGKGERAGYIMNEVCLGTYKVSACRAAEGIGSAQ